MAQKDGEGFPISDEDRDRLQKVLLEMYEDVLSYCSKENMTPFLVGGSALGAIRHGGFIPWDDDLDIGLLRSEYNRFLTGFEKEFGDKYIVNAPGRQSKTRARFTKIMKKNTIFRELTSIPDEELNGVFIDVFPIENVPDGGVRRRIKGLLTDAVAFISSQVFTKENCSRESLETLKRTGALNYYVRMITGTVFGLKNSSWWFRQYDRVSQFGDNSTKQVTISSGRKHYFGEIIDRNTVLPPRYVSFDGLSAPVFGKAENYLSNLYGNYMEIPPESKREKHFIKELRL